MDTQLTKPKIVIHRLILFLIVAVLIISALFAGHYLSQLSDPYIQEVLSLKGDASRGYDIFQINCAACHGQLADGSVGPSLQDVSKRKSRISLIQQVISGNTPPMPKFQPTTQEMADLLSYLKKI